jgi:polyisoprenoid-binding protein YceI
MILPDQSSVNFSVRNFMVGKVRGQFETFSGAIEIGPNGMPLVTARIDIRSVNTGNDKRDEHLQAAGFFDSEHHPEALFASASVLPLRDDHLLNGDLTIKGISKPVPSACSSTASPQIPGTVKCPASPRQSR